MRVPDEHVDRARAAEPATRNLIVVFLDRYERDLEAQVALLLGSRPGGDSLGADRLSVVEDAAGRAF